jgi:hypothetical protein
MARYENLNVTTLNVNKITPMRTGSSFPVNVLDLTGVTPGTGTTGFIIKAGTSAAMLTDANAGGAAIKCYINYTGTTGRYTGLWMANYLNADWTSATQGAGIYSIRGEVGQKAATTMTMSSNQGYMAGVQGKISVNGTTAGSWYMCAGLFQVQCATTATFGAGAQLYGIWVDNQASGEAWPVGGSHMINVTNNGAAIDDFMYFYGGNSVSYVFQFSTCGTCVSDSGAGGSTSKYLKCTIDGVAYSILIKSDA